VEQKKACRNYYIVILAVLTRIVGSFGGLEQKRLKSRLAYSSISHTGYILIAFTIGTFESMQILFRYLFLYMLAGL
jgi:NADH:ubiquinone oxidoreductase subunit 2 (subunit N)